MRQGLAHFFSLLKPGGGPSGYLYNLSHLKTIYGANSFDIKYFQKINNRISLTINDSRFEKARKLPLLIRKLIAASYYLSKLLSPIRSYMIYKKIKGYKYVVFHSYIDFVNYSLYFSAVSNQELILMPHSPEMHYKEIMNNLASGIFNINKYPFLLNILRYFESQAYKKAYAYVFPTKYSYEGYEDDFIKHISTKKRVIIPSTVFSEHDFSTTKKIIEKLNPKNKVVLFVGRYNEVKGFDIFIKISKKFMDRYNFVAVGAGPLECEIPSGVLNLGWQSDIYSILNQVDYVLVPNRKTYFDLLPIEALMSGCGLLLSNTGGNKFLINQDSKNILGFLNLKELYEIMDTLYLYDGVDREESLRIYNEVFSAKKFVNLHDGLIEKLAG